MEYDLELDLDFGRGLEFQGGSTAEHDYGHGSDSDAEAPEETDAMLRAGPKPVATASTVSGEGNDSYGIADNASTRGTRHARTPSAGWQAWRADYDEDNFGVNAALSTSTEQSELLPITAFVTFFFFCFFLLLRCCGHRFGRAYRTVFLGSSGRDWCTIDMFGWWHSCPRGAKIGQSLMPSSISARKVRL